MTLYRKRFETPVHALKRMLSTEKMVSTMSSLAENQRSAIGTDIDFFEIGIDCCGRVFEHLGTIYVYKMPMRDTLAKFVWTNYKLHLRIEASFKELGDLASEVKVTHALWYATESDRRFWDENIERMSFDESFARITRDVLCMERIFSLPQLVREKLIELYCPLAD
jgi:predicted regulator of amino acid metabolism with ACT domain